MRVGIDVDGVLANFQPAYISTIIAVTGRDLFPGPFGTFDIVTWNYPETYGYTTDEMAQVWNEIKEDPSFWKNLAAYPDVQEFRATIADLLNNGHDVYFITNRPGNSAKLQSETWLYNYLLLIEWPTVLISAEKGECCHALNLTHYIDDNNENCADVQQKSPSTRLFMLARTWNEVIPGVLRIGSLSIFSQAVMSHA